MSATFGPDVARAAFETAATVFTSLGRELLCLDENFRVVHATHTLGELLGADHLGSFEGRPIADLLGKELFGSGAPLRDALAGGERREGWRTLLQTPHGMRALSVTAAPLVQDASGPCDPRTRYVVVLLPAEDDHFAAAPAPAILSGLIARSPAMSRIFQLIENLQASDAPVLLTGERGTGKEVVARAIHEHSPRRRGPFVAVNCSALPEELLESELFGHVRGAFSGAVRDRIGRFELAAQGTLFLDDVDEVPEHLQLKLVRVLQEHLYERAGDSEPRATDARVIAATRSGGLHERLVRLCVPIDIPPLRLRREDIEPLARLLLRRVGERHGRHLRFSPEVVRVFLDYSWPGNVQELETAIEYGVAVARTAVIQPDDLPSEIAGRPAPAGSPDAVAASDVQRLRAALEANRWRRQETASALGISRATLWRRMRESGLL